MIGIIDIIFLVFAFLSLFISFMFLLLFAKNRGKMNVQPQLSTLPTVSLIIPAYNEEKCIARTIESAKALDYPKDKLEIIVVDDGSTDRTAEIAKGFSGIKFMQKVNEGRKAKALNYALKYSQGEMVACMDADSMPEPNALAEAVKFLADKDVGGVTTSIFVKDPKGFLGLLQKIEYAMIVWTRKMLEYMESVYVTPGPLSVYRKSAIEKVGGFDEVSATEDIEIAWRLLKHGYKIRMSTKSIVYTTAPEKVVHWWKQRLRWNIGGLQTTYMHRDSMFKTSSHTLGTFVMPFFIASFIVSLTGFGVFVYLIASWLYKFTTFTVGAYKVGVNPIERFELFYLPDIFTFFGIAVILLSMVGIIIGLKTANKSVKGVRGIIVILLYISLYITVFPINLIHSFVRIARKNTRW